MQDPNDPRNMGLGATDPDGNPIPGLVAYEEKYGPITPIQEAPAPPRGKNREELVEDYRAELKKTAWPRKHRHLLLIKFRKELTKRGVV